MKTTDIYRCSNCDAQYPKWQGRCSECSQWGTLGPDVAPKSSTMKRAARSATVVDLATVSATDVARLTTGVGEVDRVLGGGLVPGSLVLLGGDPGVGKSTLALHLAAELSRQHDVLYVSGEESAEQVGMRLKRLQLGHAKLSFLSETDLDVVLATLTDRGPKVAVIDSIQTLATDLVPSEAGSVAQVRTGTVRLLEVAKSRGIALIIIGHVTKEGAMAGPKSLEHLVDTVLYFEGDQYHAFRILRAVKNRFGSTNEVGVFDMRDDGLREVANPSQLFLAERQTGPGSVVTCVVEGSRAFLVEVQALVNPTVFGMPRRTVTGYDFNRLQLLLAVLTKRCGLKLGAQDVYVNVVGGIRIQEPAADVAIALAIASAVNGKAIDPGLVAFGEIGLGGELRSVPQTDRRLKEIKQLGFKHALVAASGKIDPVDGLDVVTQRTARDAVHEVFGKIAPQPADGEDEE